jgi:hypothetical protein
MKTRLILFLILALVLLPATAQAQEGGGYDLTWSTVDGGGATVSGGGYTLMGTVGQHDAAPALSGGGYALGGGFWPSTTASQEIFLPLVLRNYS